MVRKAALALAFLAVPVSAQQTSTTCQYIGATLNCNSNTTPGVDWGSMYRQQAEQNERIQANNRAMLEQIQRRQQERAIAERQRIEDSRQNALAEIEQEKVARLAGIKADMGKMLAEGDCAGAQKLALSAGEIDLARQAKEYCSIPAHPSP